MSGSVGGVGLGLFGFGWLVGWFLCSLFSFFVYLFISFSMFVSLSVFSLFLCSFGSLLCLVCH